MSWQGWGLHTEQETEEVGREQIEVIEHRARQSIDGRGRRIQDEHRSSVCYQQAGFKRPLASRLRINLFVQMLANRAQMVSKNTEGESNRTCGLDTSSSASKDRVVGLPSSSNLGGTGEADCCRIVVGIASAPRSMGALGESSGRRDWPSMEKTDPDFLSVANQMTGVGSWRGVCVR